MNKIAIGISIGILGLVGIIVMFASNNGYFQGKADIQNSYQITQKWELPDNLAEISGIEWLEEGKMACVQDEDGIIFIYNLKTSRIEREIRFGKGGDYEGIAIHDSTAYILRSDGGVTEINGFRSEQPEVELHETSLTGIKDLDMEGLCLDEKNNRLLLMAKANKDLSKEYKAIYAFNLETKQVSEQPVLKLQLNDALLKELDKEVAKRFNPSEIEIHPETNEFYILDAKNYSLLITNREAKPQKLYSLDKDDFVQAEGLSFSPSGSLYISNEAGEGTANILQVKLERQSK